MDINELFRAIKATLPYSLVREENAPKGLVVIHNDYNLLDTEQFNTRPDEIRTSLTLQGIPSFVTYVNRFKDDDSTIFVSPDISSLGKGQVLATAVLDYHESAGRPLPVPVTPEGEVIEGEASLGTLPMTNAPRWGRHTVALSARPGLVYEKLCKAHSHGVMDQPEFAKLIDELARHAVGIPAADLKEIARTLALTSKGDFKTADDDVSGSVDLVYNVQVQASAGTADRRLSVPLEITFAASLIDGQAPVHVACKLKYRVPEQAGAKIRLGLEILDKDWLESESIKEVTEDLSRQTGLPAYVGTYKHTSKE